MRKILPVGESLTFIEKKKKSWWDSVILMLKMNLYFSSFRKELDITFEGGIM